jgi:hypothetical protein
LGERVPFAQYVQKVLGRLAAELGLHESADLGITVLFALVPFALGHQRTPCLHGDNFAVLESVDQIVAEPESLFGSRYR